MLILKTRGLDFINEKIRNCYMILIKSEKIFLIEKHGKRNLIEWQNR